MVMTMPSQRQKFSVKKIDLDAKMIEVKWRLKAAVADFKIKSYKKSRNIGCRKRRLGGGCLDHLYCSYS